MHVRLRFRLGLDLGTNSIGWCILELNEQYAPIRLIRIGSRIFSDGRNPKDGASLAVTRRLARQMRRRRDRLLKRKHRLMQAMIRFGFMPADPTERKQLVTNNPYELRAKGLDEGLSPAEFGRALFHINQRRGFKSNRKVDKAADESGKIKKAIRVAKEALAAAGTRTIGEWLARRHKEYLPVRARLRGQGAKATYDLYIDRAMIEAEFDALWAKQAGLGPAIFHETAREELKDILLHQRPLKPVKPGRCTLEPDDERAPFALPSVQHFRIYQEVNQLRIQTGGITELALTVDQRNTVVHLLEHSAKVSFDRIRRKLKLSSTTKFNLESEKRKELKGNMTTVLLAKDDFFGEVWFEYSHEWREEIVEHLLADESETELITWLVEKTGVDELHAEQIANASLPDGFGNLGRRALARVLPKLIEDVIPYSEAVKRADYRSHSALSAAEETGEIMNTLPYYGQVLQRHVAFGTGDPADTIEKRFGKIANPTVHIGLNQVRLLVNEVVKRFGHPAEVVVEVARGLKNSRERRKEIEAEQAVKQEQNQKWAGELATMGLAANAENIQRMRLWTELNKGDPADRRCPYTGVQIGPTMLFSPEVEIEHVLPFSRTLDDSLNNKTVALRRANRDKGNQTPFEAFGHSPEINGQIYDYSTILERAAKMPKAKAKRFAEDGYQRWLREDADFLARQLNDTAYLSRIAKEYLSCICPPNRVRVIPGSLTAMLRGKFGLNQLLSGSTQKNRNDHRHHAIDATIIAVTDQGLLQRFARASGMAREQGLTKLVAEIPLPWPSYRDEVAAAVSKIVVSHKPDHSPEARLHNDTAYGIVNGPNANGVYEVVRRVELAGIDKSEKLDSIRDDNLRERIKTFIGNATDKELKTRLTEFTHQYRTRRVRVVETLTVIPVKDRRDQLTEYKAYKGDSNYCVEIYVDEKGKWRDLVVSTFDANQIQRELPFRLRNEKVAQNGRPLIMRLVQNDLVAIEIEESRKILQVAKFSEGKIYMAEHFESNVDSRVRDKSLKYVQKSGGAMQELNARRVFVTPLGYVHDPGFCK